eukprot:13736452-Heterocapsa_arctica.AAC.1
MAARPCQAELVVVSLAAGHVLHLGRCGLDARERRVAGSGLQPLGRARTISDRACDLQLRGVGRHLQRVVRSAREGSQEVAADVLVRRALEQPASDSVSARVDEQQELVRAVERALQVRHGEPYCVRRQRLERDEALLRLRAPERWPCVVLAASFRLAALRLERRLDALRA